MNLLPNILDLETQSASSGLHKRSWAPYDIPTFRIINDLHPSPTFRFYDDYLNRKYHTTPTFRIKSRKKKSRYCLSFIC